MKYSILNRDFYNFNETDFIIGIIYIVIIVISIEKYNRSKSIQLDNREWIKIIIYENKKGKTIYVFLIIQE